ncbi:MAG: tagatose-6-phosphate ketose isomerase, partial [Firmicutes bacterium]|nr:tagatose-6-phosphate ketose isomerase [Bacillota bacterium]
MFQSLNQLIELDYAAKKDQGILHTPMEIARQPEVWLETKNTMREHMEEMRNLISGDETIILTGAGSSYFAGQCVEAALAARHRGIVKSISSTEIVMNPEGTLPHTPFTLVSFARSGNSPE